MAELPIIKPIIIAVFFLIVIALGFAGISLFRKGSHQGTSTVKALTLRVGLSLVLVLAIIGLYQAGLISPNG
jgi:hypothetical protein